MLNSAYLVSAIVSVYNSERFITGCIEDLENQTIADQVEIIVVNSGSTQNEKTIIKTFQERFQNIVYIETIERESLYKAWNRGIKVASGKYITNANADDRHRKDAFELMINLLEKQSDVDFVYADTIITETENETFDCHTPVGYIRSEAFVTLEQLLLVGGFVGHQPMWRKTVNDKYGYFDEKYEVRGDYEFWLRVSESCKFRRIPKYLGLYFRNPMSVERRNYEITAREHIDIFQRYQYALKGDKEQYRKAKSKLSKRYADLGNYYLMQKMNASAMKQVINGIKCDWHNLDNYLLLMASCFPFSMITQLKGLRKQFLKSETDIKIDYQ
jgi:O-antigen biosynthesis protein